MDKHQQSPTFEKPKNCQHQEKLLILLHHHQFDPTRDWAHHHLKRCDDCRAIYQLWCRYRDQMLRKLPLGKTPQRLEQLKQVQQWENRFLARRLESKMRAKVEHSWPSFRQFSREVARHPLFWPALVGLLLLIYFK